MTCAGTQGAIIVDERGDQGATLAEAVAVVRPPLA